MHAHYGFSEYVLCTKILVQTSSEVSEGSAQLIVYTKGSGLVLFVCILAIS